MNHPRIEWAAGAGLAEGLIWHPVHRKFYFVDIHGKQIFRWCPEKRQGRRWLIDQKIGWVLPHRDPDYLWAGLKQGIALLRVSEGEELLTYDLIARVHSSDSPMRLNDAVQDSWGRIWFGTLNDEDEGRPEGRLYRFSEDSGVDIIDGDYRVPNGPVISPGDRYMLHTDSVLRRIYKFSFDAKSGEISDKSLWKEFSEEDGYPDGMTFDDKGDLWVAFWGSGTARKFDPAGKMLMSLGLPAPLVTNVCLRPGFPDCLMLTTANSSQLGLSKQSTDAEGALLSVRL